ncbi:MAG: hypothetical protein QNJ42_23960 [Crocosphaera sp.]|nr:hypothetical protein [Crocosphaera sp.]
MRTFDKTLENPKFSETERHSLENKKFVAPPLDDELYAESYQLRKAASTMTVTAIEWFRNNIKLVTSQQDDTLSIQRITSKTKRQSTVLTKITQQRNYLNLRV